MYNDCRFVCQQYIKNYKLDHSQFVRSCFKKKKRHVVLSLFESSKDDNGELAPKACLVKKSVAFQEF